MPSVLTVCNGTSESRGKHELVGMADHWRVLGRVGRPSLHHLAVKKVEVNMKLKCKCHPDSPFHWVHDKSPTVFARDINFRASKTGQTLSQASTANVEKAREDGKMAGFLRGISKNREEEILRVRNFLTFSLAVANDATKRKDTNDQVPPVRGVD